MASGVSWNIENAYSREWWSSRTPHACRQVATAIPSLLHMRIISEADEALPTASCAADMPTTAAAAADSHMRTPASVWGASGAAMQLLPTHVKAEQQQVEAVCEVKQEPEVKEELKEEQQQQEQLVQQHPREPLAMLKPAKLLLPLKVRQVAQLWLKQARRSARIAAGKRARLAGEGQHGDVPPPAAKRARRRVSGGADGGSAAGTAGTRLPQSSLDMFTAAAAAAAVAAVTTAVDTAAAGAGGTPDASSAAVAAAAALAQQAAVDAAVESAAAGSPTPAPSPEAHAGAGAATAAAAEAASGAAHAADFMVVEGTRGKSRCVPRHCPACGQAAMSQADKKVASKTGRPPPNNPDDPRHLKAKLDREFLELHLREKPMPLRDICLYHGHCASTIYHARKKHNIEILASH